MHWIIRPLPMIRPDNPYQFKFRPQVPKHGAVQGSMAGQIVIPISAGIFDPHIRGVPICQRLAVFFTWNFVVTTWFQMSLGLYACVTTVISFNMNSIPRWI